MSTLVLGNIEIPPQKPSHSHKKRSPSQLRAWIESLPYGSIPEVTKNLVEKLARQNRRQQSYSHRLAQMKLFEAPAQKIRQSCLQSDVKISHFEQKYQVLSVLSKKLNKELAYGYKAIIIDCLEEGKRWGQNKVLAIAIQQALLHMGHAIFDRFSRYECNAPHAWREFNVLYALAESRRLHRNPIPHPLDPKRYSTIERSYKTLMLLSLTDPYHLPYGETALIYHYLDIHADLAEITQASPSFFGQKGEFLLDLEGNQPARYYLPEDFKFQGRRHRLLRTHSALLDQVQADINRIKRGQIPTALQNLERGGSLNTEKMLRHMLTAWQSSPLRDFPRQEDSGQIKALYGLERLHDFLRQDPAQTQDLSTDLKEECKRLDSGPQGMGLSIPLPTQLFITVGELFAVQMPHTESESYWVVAAVRWLQRTKKHTIKAGIQYLARHPQPVLIHALDTKGKLGEGLAGLQIQDKEGQPTGEIISPTQLFQQGRRFKLTVAKKSISIIAESLVESTSGFDLFRYSVE